MKCCSCHAFPNALLLGIREIKCSTELYGVTNWYKNSQVRSSVFGTDKCFPLKT